MISKRVRRTSFVAAVAGFALVTLSGCINITYNLSVNPDATLSGKVQLAVAKQAASILGIKDANDLNDKMKSGQLSNETPTSVVNDCTASEDATNLILNCTFENAKASDLNEAWTMTVNGDTATFHAVLGDSTSGEAAGLPGIDAGGYDLTLTYPGPISSVTGDRAVQSGPNTVTVKGSLDQPLDLTVVGSLSSGSSSMLWIFILLGVLAIIAIAVLAFVLRSGSRKSKEQPAIEGTADAPMIESAPEQAGEAPEAPQAPETPETPEGSGSGEQQ